MAKLEREGIGNEMVMMCHGSARPIKEQRCNVIWFLFATTTRSIESCFQSDRSENEESENVYSCFSWTVLKLVKSIRSRQFESVLRIGSEELCSGAVSKWQYNR